MTVRVHMGDGTYAELEPEKYEVDAALLEPTARPCAECGHLHYLGGGLGWDECPIDGCDCHGQNWAPEVLVDGKWGGNALVFETKGEAEAWAKDLLNRWFVPTDSRAVVSTKKVNARIRDGVMEHVR